MWVVLSKEEKVYVQVESRILSMDHGYLSRDEYDMSTASLMSTWNGKQEHITTASIHGSS